eukprot:1160311-Pelagomonas_calceolata.AAC.5
MAQELPAIITGRTDITRDPYSTITARNVPFKASEADIVHFFGQAGKVRLGFCVVGAYAVLLCGIVYASPSSCLAPTPRRSSCPYLVLGLTHAMPA